MNQQTDRFQKGTWIVHQSYGVGQIQGVETRRLGGKEGTYYHLLIHATESHIWVPVDKLDDVSRPLTPPEKFKNVLAILERPPRKMATHINQRTNRIRDVRSQNSPMALARLLRDMLARKKERGALSQSESTALRRIKTRFLGEWAASMKLDLEEAEQQMMRLLQRGYQKSNATD